MTHTDYHLLKSDLLKTLYPAKPAYRKVGKRNGKNLYELCGWKINGNFVRMKRTPYLQTQLKYSDPHKEKLLRGFARKIRVIQRSEPWYARAKGFWKGLLGL